MADFFRPTTDAEYDLLDEWSLPYFCVGGAAPPVPPITINPVAVQNDGGYPITVTSTLLEDGVYYVHVGPLGTAADPLCYSGVEGQGQFITIADGEMSVVVPPLPVGTWGFFLERVSGSGSDGIEVPPSLIVTPHDFRSRTLSLRRSLPSWLALGLRAVRYAPFPQE